MRIARLATENPRTQGPQRRAWYRRHSPEHLDNVAALIEEALRARGTGAPSGAVLLGAGACTELPLERLARACDAVLLVDVDVAGMARARDGLPAALRGRVDLAQADITGGVSDALARELRTRPWDDLARLDGRGVAALEATADCLERCPVLDPPLISPLAPGGYGLVVSSLALTQLYSLPLLDVLDTLNLYAPAAADARDGSPRYRTAASGFRRRVSLAHLALLASLLAPDGAGALISDRIGYLLPPRGGPHARDAREAFPVLPEETLAVPADLETRFARTGSVRTWRWLVTAPDATTPGRAYDVVGVALRPLSHP